MNIFKTRIRGNKVTQVKLLLNGHLSPLINIKNDGHFGKNTEMAIMAFQRKKVLT
jgi:peptidoglycan hydrolase-like protein with peptidoglycan-binding domain